MSTKKIVTATGLYQAIGNGCNENKSSMSLNKMRQNLTKTTAVAAVIGIATCLFPAIAQAQSTRPRASGDGDVNSNTTIEFFVDTSVKDINLNPDVGEFPRAIQDFIDTGSQSDELDRLEFRFGNLRTSRLTIDPTTDPGDPELFPTIRDYTDNDNIRVSDILSPGSTFNNDWLRYDVTFDNESETLTLFLPSNDSSNDPRSLINSLSGFNNVLASNRIQAVVSRPDIGRIEKILESNDDPSRRALRVTVATVPEPTATASLLSVGALGAVSLLKRNKRLRKSV
jgi:preprotein translocase subunit SecG